ncbi:thiosulfate reductase cytochrome b subunit [Algoriphagus boseongensis]|uniref:Thiosulfate reductase cytochrome b subunit n=1 Tax=Algoriphagus boseongensis TaxID=1442587 RepID=A0A4R6T4J9_9BACT|nr:cytochrome b/b6 domain-containing protein [Algoriphagus boseongensis]TDQ16672.1 thiosulfate reductase cytochrome b subunit [Algoriphagus boseongensis]
MEKPKHKAWVKGSHWFVTLSFFILLVTGFEMTMVHPRFYWGEVGNDLTPALFEVPVSINYKHGGWDQITPFSDEPNSPVTGVRTFDIFNQNSWGRSLHFLGAWILVLVGLLYLILGILTKHFSKHLLPKKKELSSEAIKQEFKQHINLKIPPATFGPSYSLFQKSAYLLVIFFLFPVMILTGFTMSPGITAAYPFLLKMFFGAQSARTIHFLASFTLVLFLLVHLVMITKSGFKNQLKGMTTGK